MRKLIKTLLPKETLELYSLIKQETGRCFSSEATYERFRQLHHDRKAVFIHIPKAAGNSVSKTIFGLSSIEIGGHTDAFTYQMNSRRLFRKYFIFAFVRNPYDRLYSAFNFLLQGGMNNEDQAFANEYIVPKKTFHNFIYTLQDPEYLSAIKQYWHFKDQYKYICDKSNNLIIDYIARYENFDSEMVHICEKLDIDYIFSEENVTPGKNPSYIYQYTPEMIDIVGEVYKTDFAILNYSRSLKLKI